MLNCHSIVKRHCTQITWLVFDWSFSDANELALQSFQNVAAQMCKLHLMIQLQYLHFLLDVVFLDNNASMGCDV